MTKKQIFFSLPQTLKVDKGKTVWSQNNLLFYKKKKRGEIKHIFNSNLLIILLTFTPSINNHTYHSYLTVLELKSKL